MKMLKVHYHQKWIKKKQEKLAIVTKEKNNTSVPLLNTKNFYRVKIFGIAVIVSIIMYYVGCWLFNRYFNGPEKLRQETRKDDNKDDPKRRADSTTKRNTRLQNPSSSTSSNKHMMPLLILILVLGLALGCYLYWYFVLRKKYKAKT